VTSHSTLYQLIESRLPGTLADYIATGLSAGKSWRTLADDVERDTDCRVTFETLRRWFANRIEVTTTVRVA
jgi:hypothetical protein